MANAAFALLGAINAGLVVRIARRLKLSRAAALLGGGFYAVWFGAIGAEVSVRLEPLGSFAFLCGVLALLSAAGPDAADSHRATSLTRRGVFLAGVAFGVAASVKIWWIVALVVVLAWLLSTGGRRAAMTLVAGAGVAMAAIDGPFFVNAHTAMWRMVVTDQLRRHAMTGSRAQRIGELSTLGPLQKLALPERIAILVALAVLALVLACAAWRVRRCRVVVIVAVAQLVVLLVSPIYISYYSGYIAASASIVVAAAAHHRHVRGSVTPGFAAALITVAGVASLTVGRFTQPLNRVAPFPGSQLASGVTRSRCVMADSPMALIALNALSRDLAHGCPNWVDVSGRTYDVDALHGGHFRTRAHNARWQHDLRRYLLSGDAMILIRSATGVSTATERILTAYPVLERSHGYTVYRVNRPEH